MSPRRDMTGGPMTPHDLRLSLAYEQPGPGLIARMALDDPSGLRLVELELSGDELARVLAGEVVSVTGTVAVEQPLDVAPVEPVIEDEPEVEPADEPRPAEYSTLFDEPPPGTEPIMRSTDVERTQEVVAYVGGRWREARVIDRGIGRVLVEYSRGGPFAKAQRQRVPVEWVRRRT